MKFTKEDAFESLKRKLTNNERKTLRMSEKSLQKLTENLMGDFADDETGLPDFVDKVLPFLETFNSNIEKDRSDFIKQWKEEHPDPTSKTTETEEPKENSEMKALMERIAALEADKKESEKKASIAQKRKEAVSKLKEKGVKDDDWVNDFLSEVNITEDFDVDSKTEQWVKLYNKSKASGGATVTPEQPTGGSKDSKVSNVIKAAADLAKSNKAAGIVQTN